MPQTNFMLALLVFCFVTPWIVGELVDNETTTVEAQTNGSYYDDTRREDQQLLNELNTTSQTTIENKNEERNLTESLRSSLLALPIEVTEDSEVPCDNAQFLLKILTVMLPILKNDVPENARTGYILLVLKDLLKSSPEAAQDYQIMYKINDLLETLVRFHENNRHALGNKNDALRTSDIPEATRNGVRSKIVFKYEVPHLANPDCTAELLTIIKTVQHAIMSLVNNPLCKFHIPLETPILTDVSQYLANPNLYSYDIKKPIEDLPLLPDAEQKYNYFDINVSDNTGPDDKPNYYDKSPFNQNQKNPLYPNIPLNKPYYTYPEQPNIKRPIDQPIDSSHSIEISPDILSIINGDLDGNKYDLLNPKESIPSVYEIERPHSDTPYYIDILPNVKHEVNVQMPISPLDVTDENVQVRPYKKIYQIPLRPIKQPPKHKKPYEEIGTDRDYDIGYPHTSPLPFDVYGDGSGEFEIDKNRLYPALDLHVPPIQQDITKYRPSPGHPKIFKYDLQPPNSHSPLDIYGDDNSAEIPIDIFRPADQPIEKPKPSLFDVDGSTESAYYIPLHPKPYNPDLYVMYPDQNPVENPNKHNTGNENLPAERGVPVLPNNRPEPPYNPYLPNDLSNEVPNNPNNLYLPNDNYESFTKPFIPFDVSGEGSGEIQLGPTESPISDYIDFYVPKKPKTKAKYPNDYPNPSYFPYKKETPKVEPEAFLVEDSAADRDDAGLVISNPIDFTSDQDGIVISELTTKRPSRPVVENQYEIPEVLDFEDILSHSDGPRPNYINHENEPSSDYYHFIQNLPRPILVPDNKILHIINDNIDLVQQKIPSKHLNEEIRDMITRLKDLLNKKQITVEEYVNVINQYQIFVEYVKHLDISNAIMMELLLSMTNLDKLNLQTGKSPVIELTYLIKRPEPLVYQPYYYIKYQLPYNSFLKRVQTLLALKPNLKNNPAKLYKALISMSKISETSPDLDKYDAKDIFKLAFHKGTLVGAKLMKGGDLNMYGTLTKLININSDYFIEDVYELIRNLDTQLKHTNDGLVLESTNIPTFGIHTDPGEIHIVKVKKQPMLQKVTKIVTNEVDADHIFVDILNKMKNLRTNESANHTEEEINPTLKNSTDQTNKSAPLIARTGDTYNLNQFNTGIPLNRYDTINYNTNTNPKAYLPEDYKNDADKYYGLNTKTSDLDLNFNKPYSHVREYDKRPGLNQGEWSEGTINSFNNKPKSQNHKSFDSDSFVKYKPSNAPYLTDDDSAIFNSGVFQNQQINSLNLLNRVKDYKNYKQDNYASQKDYFDSMPTSVSINENIDNPNNLKSHLVTHTKTYINGVPVKHTKSYRIEKPYNEVQEFETSYPHHKEYNKEYSQYLVDFNPNIVNKNYSQYQDNNFGKESLISDKDSTKYNAKTESGAYSNDNIKNYYDMFKKLSPTQDLNFLKQYQSYNADKMYKIAQNPAQTINNNQFNNQYSDGQNYNTGSSVGNYGVYNQNFIPNYAMNPRYIIHQNWPLLYQLYRPRVLTHPLLG